MAVNILDIFRKAFGTAYSPVGTIAHVPKLGQHAWILEQGLTAQITEGVDFDSQTLQDVEGDSTSLLGTHIFLPCKLNDYMLPNEPLISISGKNRIVKTEIDGNEGTFKEKFSRDDYSILIRGVAINEQNPDEYPTDIVRKLRQLCEETEVSVVNRLLGHFNVNQLVIESYNFPSVEGMIGVQPYEFKCLSDKTFELELIDG